MGDGKTDEAKGRIKEAAGSLTDNKRLEAEGSGDRAKGSLKDVKGAVSDKAGSSLPPRMRSWSISCCPCSSASNAT